MIPMRGAGRDYQMAAENTYHHLHVEKIGDRWWLVWPDGSRFEGQSYKTYPAARRALKDYMK